MFALVVLILAVAIVVAEHYDLGFDVKGDIH